MVSGLVSKESCKPFQQLVVALRWAARNAMIPATVRFETSVVRPRKKGSGTIMMRRKSGEEQPIRVLLEFFSLIVVPSPFLFRAVEESVRHTVRYVWV